MTKTSFFNTLKRFWYSHRKCDIQHQSSGFTLLELLIVTIISGGIIAGLTYIVVELLTADRRENALTETQQDMQRALDFMAAELREAVYVYSGECLRSGGGGDPSAPCPGLVDYLPVGVSTNSVPVVAFWKQEPIPSTLRQQCRNSTRANPLRVSGVFVPCLTAHSYSLVVYSLSKENTNNTWKGLARLTRTALTEFTQTGNRTQGYVNPGANAIYNTWPFGPPPSAAGGGTLVNLQAFAVPAGRPDISPTVLVDFVDDGTGAQQAGLTGTASCPDNPATAQADYSISPTTAELSRLGFANVRSFYACISQGETVGTTPSDQNREVILYLRGNAFGKPVILSRRGFLPTLETRVLSRGVLERIPSN
jgi:prepilin-type N-terminal cleavage/methylation domain-containing protein